MCSTSVIVGGKATGNYTFDWPRNSRGKSQFLTFHDFLCYPATSAAVILNVVPPKSALSKTCLVNTCSRKPLNCTPD